MARDSGANQDLLKAALIGYQVQRERISALIADLQNQLGHRGPGRPKAVTANAAPAGPKPKRKLSAAGRARIIAATKARWAAYREAKQAAKRGK